MEQNIKLRCLRLNTLLIREVVIDAVRYFYEESFGSSVYIDPLSLTAARRLKNQVLELLPTSLLRLIPVSVCGLISGGSCLPFHHHLNSSG